jgi:hypothetical protein
MKMEWVRGSIYECELCWISLNPSLGGDSCTFVIRQSVLLLSMRKSLGSASSVALLDMVVRDVLLQGEEGRSVMVERISWDLGCESR